MSDLKKRILKTCKVLCSGIREGWYLEQVRDADDFRIVRYHSRGNQISRRFRSQAEAEAEWAAKGKDVRVR